MIESIEKVKIEDKFISKEDVDPALHNITVKRKAKTPELEEYYDKDLTPRELRQKYEQTFMFRTEDQVTRTWNLLHELEEEKSKIFVSFGIGSAIFVQSPGNMDLHDEFNRIEQVQIKEILEWCYEI